MKFFTMLVAASLLWLGEASPAQAHDFKSSYFKHRHEDGRHDHKKDKHGHKYKTVKTNNAFTTVTHYGYGFNTVYQHALPVVYYQPARQKTVTTFKANNFTHVHQTLPRNNTGLTLNFSFD